MTTGRKRGWVGCKKQTQVQDCPGLEGWEDWRFETGEKGPGGGGRETTLKIWEKEKRYQESTERILGFFDKNRRGIFSCPLLSEFTAPTDFGTAFSCFIPHAIPSFRSTSNLLRVRSSSSVGKSLLLGLHVFHVLNIHVKFHDNRMLFTI